MADNADKNINISPVPKFVDTALLNITDEPTKSIGNTFSDLWFLVFGGIGQSAEKRKMLYAVELKKYEAELSEKILSIPPERVDEVDMQVVAPALEASKYCVEKEELRGMFVNLIASSIDSDKKDRVHPSFPHIISRMSAYEARLFRFIAISSEKRLKEIKNDDGLLPVSIDKMTFSLAVLQQFGLLKDNMKEKLIKKQKEQETVNNNEYLFRYKHNLMLKYDSVFDTMHNSDHDSLLYTPYLNLLYNSIFELLKKYMELEGMEEVLPNHKTMYEFLATSFSLTSVGKVFSDICLCE